MIGSIVAFVMWFGFIMDILPSPTCAAFILLERKEIASAAFILANSVMGRRHTLLAWAGDSDFAEADFSLTNNGKRDA